MGVRLREAVWDHRLDLERELGEMGEIKNGRSKSKASVGDKKAQETGEMRYELTSPARPRLLASAAASRRACLRTASREGRGGGARRLEGKRPTCDG